MRRSTPIPVWILAVTGTIFVTLPLLALLVRAPWSDLGDAIAGAGGGTALRLSVLVSVAATAGSLAFGVPLAWILARAPIPGRRLVRAIVVLPIVLPPVV